ncbi:tRNA adenosine(34) deaminase TadA [Thalassotalea sp. 1_MG-2023]|uniref:tRNA adenosine(34) deaminase TadA n=1 Tax=Thalassotalea sp. 1_MG-2023 TaxID=3062680 RepID=UPI0026E3373B|nr:tRNA adenosine(34) deaminase TadA [Thalassotalea sp. 1_MG-2023]MDO6426769.1 tRNA adenosine(34) deaminase TadA [Thalassotalea sp. 1_MG-2023]
MTQYNQTEIDYAFMAKAYALALKAEQHDEIPVGAVVVADGHVIGEGFNQSIMQHDPSAHAEMIAIRQAGKTLENYRMLDCTLYVTLEPCPMCAGLLVHSRIKRVVFACADEKTGSAGSVFDLTRNDKLNHQIEITSGVMATECSALLSSFFKRRRLEKKALKQVIKSNKNA